MKMKSMPQLRCFLPHVLLGAALLLFCAIDAHADSAEGAEQPSEQNNVPSEAVTKDQGTAGFLGAIFEPLIEETTQKVEKLQEKGEPLPMEVRDPTVDCTEYDESLQDYGEKMMASMMDVREILYANNNELTLWGKVKAINALRILLQYMIVERPFTPGYCLEIFEEEFFPPYDRLTDEVIELSGK